MSATRLNLQYTQHSLSNNRPLSGTSYQKTASAMTMQR